MNREELEKENAGKIRRHRKSKKLLEEQLF